MATPRRSRRPSTAASPTATTNALPVFTVEHWPIERVIPYARNPRKNTAAVAQVAASLREFGWRQPLVVDTAGVLVVGHTRLLAARQLGQTHVPVHVATGLTPAQAKAYRLADNRTGEDARWDAELLGVELEELQGLDVDLHLTGFTDGELAQYLGTNVTEGLDPGTGGYREQYGVIVLCEDAAAQERIYDALQAEGYRCRVVTT